MKDSLKEIINIVGEDNILSLSTELDHYSVDGKRPDLVAFPETVEEVSQIMKVASRESLAVIPWGGGTKIGFGREPHKVDIVLCTERLNRVLEYEASDLVATAQCGISLKELQRVLKEKKQFLSIDPPHIQSGATLGGIIATNDSGPRRLKFGTMRESLIGIKVVRPDGSIIKGGAKVVKNVAGYDLPKLYVGSLGTLGIIVEGTFRLHPIPETSETLLFSFPALEMSQETVLSVLNSSLVPSCLEILNPPLINAISDKLNLNFKKEKYALSIRIEGVEKAVRDQISKVKDICREKNGEEILIESNLEENLWEEIREFPWKISGVRPGPVLSSEAVELDNRAVCKASVLITDVLRVLRVSEELSKNSGVRIYISARAGNGVLIISIEGEILSVIESTKSLRDLVSSLKGALVIQEAPFSLKAQVDVWGEIGSSLKVMEKLRTLFDPYCILNPGRFVDGR
jgi:glycolate dehydrogenase FAD-binding subunit